MLLNEEFVFLETIAISSAYAKALILHVSDSTSAGMLLFSSILRISGSIAIMNRAQLKASPCLTPLRIGKAFDINPLICTCA